MRFSFRLLVLPVAMFGLSSLQAETLLAGAVPIRGIGTILSEVRPPGSACSMPATVNWIGSWPFSTNTLSTPEGPFYHVIIVGCNYPDSVGLGGIEFGVQYDGAYAPAGGATPISVFSWTLCGDLEFPSAGWPAPGTGNLVTWTQVECGNNEFIDPYSYFILKVAGFFYMGAYAPSSLDVVPRQVSGFMKVADCSGREHDVTLDSQYAGGQAGFQEYGWPGCLGEPLPVRPTTWSGVKSLYR